MTVFVSLATIHSRISSIHRVIQSLLSNKIPDNFADDIQIRLFVSKDPFLVDAGVTSIPDSLDNISQKLTNTNSRFNFTIESVPNLGPHRKYIFNVLHEEDILITVDDDTIYPNDFLSRMISALNSFNCVVAMRGRKIKHVDSGIAPYNQWVEKVDSCLPSCAYLGTGKDGIAYKLKFLHPSVWNKDNAMMYASRADDLWLKAHSLLNGVPTVVLSSSLEDEFNEIGDPRTKISLYNSFNKHGGNDLALQSIDSYLMSNFQVSFFYLSCL